MDWWNPDSYDIWELNFRAYMEVIPNPFGNNLILEFYPSHYFSTDDLWVWLVDLGQDKIEFNTSGLTTFMNADQITWSSDGYLAYQSWDHCSISYWCDDVIFIYGNGLFHHTLTAPPHGRKFSARLNLLFWLDPATLVYTYGFEYMDADSPESGIVFHNVVTGEDTVYEGTAWPEEIQRPTLHILTFNQPDDLTDVDFYLTNGSTTTNAAIIDEPYYSIERTTVDVDLDAIFGEDHPIYGAIPCYLHAPC